MRFHFLLSVLFMSSALFAQGPEAIEYAKTGNFTWSLFKGKINPQHIAQMGKNTGAVTVSSLSYTTVKFTPNSVILKVTAKFHPTESWTRYPKLHNPGHALNHEKRHFDLSEVYARKIRQRISETTFTRRNLNVQLKTIFAELSKEHSLEQSNYDHETEHSIDPEQQAIWNKMIDKRLNELAEYSEPVISIPLN